MFINSGFAGGGSKHGHNRRVQKSNNQLGLNHLGRNSTITNKGDFQNIHLSKQRMKSIKNTSPFVSIRVFPPELTLISIMFLQFFT